MPRQDITQSRVALVAVAVNAITLILLGNKLLMLPRLAKALQNSSPLENICTLIH